MGSTLVLSQILRNERNRKSTLQRLWLFMSCFDILSAVFIIIDETVFMTGYTVYPSFCVIAILYSTAIALYSWGLLRFGWCKLKIRKMEPWIHVSILVTGIISFTIFEVIAGDEKKWFGRIFLPISCLLMVVISLDTYRIARKSDLSVQQYRISASDSVCFKYSKAVYMHSLLFISGFLITWSTYIFLAILGLPDSHWLNFIKGYTFPLQGFFNAIVFFRPRFVKTRKEEPEANAVYIILSLLKTSILWGCAEKWFTSDEKDLIKQPFLSS